MDLSPVAYSADDLAEESVGYPSPEPASEPDLDSYERVIVAFSGGKDSLACLLHLLDRGVSAARIELWHHDVDGQEGSELMDWPCTRAYCRAVADALGIPLYYSWKVGGFEQEMLRDGTPTSATRFETPGGEVVEVGGRIGRPGTRLQFPQVSSDLRVRWCSAYVKIDVCDRAIKNQPRFRDSRTLVVSGERAQESPSRARYLAFELDRADGRDTRHRRHVDRWRPVHSWSEQEVWAAIERWRVNPHPAYRLGWGRVSCMTCIFGSAAQWASVAHLAPARLEQIARYEERFGKTIHRTRSVRRLAIVGQPYAWDEADAQAAMSRTFDEPAILPPGTWRLPRGAYGESCGRAGVGAVAKYWSRAGSSRPMAYRASPGKSTASPVPADQPRPVSLRRRCLRGELHARERKTDPPDPARRRSPVPRRSCVDKPGGAILHEAGNPRATSPPGPRRHALVIRSKSSLAARETRIAGRSWRVEPELADLPVRAVVTLADGGSCRPRSLCVDGREVVLAKSITRPGWLVVQGEPVCVGRSGTDVHLSVEVANEEYHPSEFWGAILLGEWDVNVADLITDLVTVKRMGDSSLVPCPGEGSCRVPSGGGSCRGCGYPRAYAHPSSLLDAFLVDQVYVGGTAVQVYPDPGVPPGAVRVVQRDGRRDEYRVPPSMSAAPGGEPLEDRAADLDERLLRASPRQLQAGADSPAESLGVVAQARLLEYAAGLLRCEADPEHLQRDLALALVAGVLGLSRGYYGYLDSQSSRVLERALGRSASRREAELVRPVALDARTLLEEVGHGGRAWRVRSVCAAPRLVVADRRLVSRPGVSYGGSGPFRDPVSRVRVAVVPGEAEHVRVYDLFVADPTDGVGYSVLDRVPGYGPEAVRESAPVDLGPELGGSRARYLPGSAFCGRLAEGATLDYPSALPPEALSGGVLVDLGRTFPSMSRVYLAYQVDPGHLLVAIIEPV